MYAKKDIAQERVQGSFIQLVLILWSTVGDFLLKLTCNVHRSQVPNEIIIHSWWTGLSTRLPSYL